MGHNRIAGAIFVVAAAIVYVGGSAGRAGPEYLFPALTLCVFGLLVFVLRDGGKPS